MNEWLDGDYWRDVFFGIQYINFVRKYLGLNEGKWILGM